MLRSHRLPTTARRRAFTLIELLTVIAIIGILAAILIPVTGAVRKSARNAQCTSNLRQCGSAMLLHANENKNRISFKVGGTGGAKVWAEVLAPYFVPQYNGTDQNRGLDVLYCPSAIPYRHDPSISPWSWNTYGGYFVTTGARGVKKASENDGAWTSLQVQVNSLEAPSRYPMFMDSVRANDGRQRMNIIVHTATAAQPAVHLRHGNRANTVFYDGHVAGLDRQALKDIGFISVIGDNLDIVDL